MKPARIALVGIILESNRQAPPTLEADFRNYAWLEGDAVTALIRSPACSRFAERMDFLRSWEPAPILLVAAESGGPCDAALADRLLSMIQDRLKSAGPVDGVFIYGHGAASTTASDDLDGLYFATIRACVGPAVPIVAELDFHANVSEAMIEAADVMVGYRTNPHVDVAERAGDCADLLHRLMLGERLCKAAVRLPLVTAQITQLTDPGEPAGDLIAWAEEAAPKDITSFSVLPGFAFTDTAYNGFTVLVYSSAGEASATAFALQVAGRAWDGRDRFVREATPLAEAVRLAAEVCRGDRPGPIVLADVADNPGGGGRGNTVFLLRALLDADARGAVVGVLFDRALAAEARGLGVGTSFEARFNREETTPFSEAFAHPARVIALSDGRFVNRLGVGAGQAVDLGDCALLDLEGVKVAVSTNRLQVMSPDYFSHLGLDVSATPCFAVKSRGHFRAGFEAIATGDRVIEVATPGLTTPDLSTVAWTRLPRPVFPLDPDAVWTGQPLALRSPLCTA